MLAGRRHLSTDAEFDGPPAVQAAGCSPAGQPCGRGAANVALTIHNENESMERSQDRGRRSCDQDRALTPRGQRPRTRYLDRGHRSGSANRSTPRDGAKDAPGRHRRGGTGGWIPERRARWRRHAAGRDRGRAWIGGTDWTPRGARAGQGRTRPLGPPFRDRIRPGEGPPEIESDPVDAKWDRASLDFGGLARPLARFRGDPRTHKWLFRQSSGERALTRRAPERREIPM